MRLATSFFTSAVRRSHLAGAALLVTAALGAGCSDDENTESRGGVITYDDFPESVAGADRSDDLGIARAIVLQPGFADGAAIQYVDFGEVNPVVPKVYIVVDGGTPVAGQYPIIDTMPDKPDYSTYWQVVEVEAPGGYKANDLKSLSGLKAAGLKMTEKLEAVHCAVVNPDATWVTADLSATLNVFWATGEDQPNPYFDPEAEVGPNNPIFGDETLAQEGDIVLQPVWHKRLLGFCYAEDLSARVPLVEDEDGVVSIDDSALGVRYDTGLLPVFDGDGGLAIAADTVPLVNGQPGSADDVDTEGAAPYTYVDNPILGGLALDRFEIVFANTTPVPPDSKSVPIGPGAALVADAEGVDTDGDEEGALDTPYIWMEGFPVSGELAALIAESNILPLATAFAPDFLFGPFADFHQLPPIAPQESYTIIVLATPFLGVVSTAHMLPGQSDAFAGAVTGLYDETFAPVATQTVDLMVYTAGLETEEGIVVLSEDITDPVGTLTITHL